jgi:hypothetical protein
MSEKRVNDGIPYTGEDYVPLPPHAHHESCSHNRENGQPIIRIPLADLPSECGSCGHEGSEWPLSVYGNILHVSCPVCFAIVAPVRAVGGSPQ